MLRGMTPWLEGNFKQTFASNLVLLQMMTKEVREMHGNSDDLGEGEMLGEIGER